MACASAPNELGTVRGVLSAKVPNSSFAEAHKVLLSEPTHMEDEDQENEVEDERDCEESKRGQNKHCA